jgi:two-component system response regulator AtoC
VLQDAGQPHPLLIVDRDREAREELAARVAQLGRSCVEASSAREALDRLAAERCDGVFLARELPEGESLALLRAIRQRWPELSVVVVSSARGARAVVESLRAGASDFLRSPFDAAELARVLASCAPMQAPASAREGAARSPGGFAVAGAAMREVLERIDAVAGTDLTVLVRGESGTGKELVARALCAGSPRRDRPFVKVCCAAIPDELLESELFGYERGAFTGAERRRLGRFHAADGGTIFLDEISELSPRMQAKLLQVLQDGRFARLGGEDDAAVDVRVIAATQRDLAAGVASGRFRPDLYYRLNVVSIQIPPLRARRDEIEPLARHFAARFARDLGRAVPGLAPEVRELLLAHTWPGNVRELENLMKRWVLLADEHALVAELRGRIARAPAPPAPGPLERYLAGAAPTLSLKALACEAARRAESRAIARALERTRWNRREAARILQISNKALLYKMRDAGLDAVAPQA